MSSKLEDIAMEEIMRKEGNRLVEKADERINERIADRIKRNVEEEDDADKERKKLRIEDADM